MRRANTGVFAAFLLVFLLLLAAPLLFFLYGYGFLQLPKLTYLSVTVAATAGLFIIPVFLIFLTAIITLSSKRKRAVVAAGLKQKQEPEHYPWEGVFRTAEKEEFEAARAKVKAAFAAPKLVPKLNATALLVVAVIVAATVVFFVMVVPTAKDVLTTGGKVSNLTNLTKLSTAEDASNTSNAVKNESANTLLQFLKAKLSSLKKGSITNLTEAAQLAEAAKAKAEEAKAKQKEREPSSFSALATKFKAAALKAFAFWPYALVGIGVLVLLAGGFYFYKAKKAKPAAEWFRACAADSADWLAVLLAEVKRNSTKLLIFAAVVAVAALAFAFRNWLKVKLSVFSKAVAPVLATIRESAISFFYATRNFLLAYRLYIIIGVAVLLVALCVLFLLERREKEKGLEPVQTAPKKSRR